MVRQSTGYQGLSEYVLMKAALFCGDPENESYEVLETDLRGLGFGCHVATD